MWLIQSVEYSGSGLTRNRTVPAMADDDINVESSSAEAALAEQLDEVQLLEAMAGRDGEFEWRRGKDGRVSGRLQAFLQLDGEMTVRVARRDKWGGPRHCSCTVIAVHNHSGWLVGLGIQLYHLVKAN